MLNRREATLAIAALLAGTVGVGVEGQEAQPPRDATGGRPAEPARRGAAGGDAFFVSPPLAGDEAEQRILDVLSEMDQHRARMQSVPMDDGRFLRLLAEFAGARHVVEIGTSQGVSALWFCLALRNTGGKLTTFEINPERAELARANFKRAGVEDLVSLVLGDAHEKVVEVAESMDLLFLDADKPGYRDYLEKLFPKLRPGGLVVAHNMDARMADPAFVEAITTDPRLDSLLVRLQAGGISVSLKKRGRA